jgi:FkbM family methyltransferase
MAYAGQFGQDEFLDRVVFRGLFGGRFVDVGAHDGETFSNTIFFEREREWHGLCIEPNPRVFARLQVARRAECLPCCIGVTPGIADFLQIEGQSDMLSGLVESYPAKHRERIETESREDGSAQKIIAVKTVPLHSIFAERGIAEVHLLSIDTEGGEIGVLNSIDFARVMIHAIAIENNYRDSRISDLLLGYGFVPVIRLAVDVIFVNRRSSFFSHRLLRQCLTLRVAARIERKLRKLQILAPGPVRFPYKRPQYQRLTATASPRPIPVPCGACST